MAWTQTDLDEIEKAIATGARRVKFSDREVEYASTTDLLRVRDLIRKTLGTASEGSGNIYPTHSKGFS